MEEIQKNNNSIVLDEKVSKCSPQVSLLLKKIYICILVCATFPLHFKGR